MENTIAMEKLVQTHLEELVKKEGNNKSFEYKNFECMIRRNSLLEILCGYVKIPTDHPLFGLEWPDINTISAYGGITFTGQFDKHNEWWIGFDCGHWEDAWPGYKTLNPAATYKDMQFVENEIKELVDSIIKIYG